MYLSGVIICPAKRTAVIRRTPSPCAIIRSRQGKSTIPLPAVPKLKTRLLRDGMRFRAGLHGVLRGNNAAVNTEGKKAIPARRTAIGGDAKEKEQPGEHAHSMVARNSRQIQVAAQFAMHVADVSDGSRPGVKASVARTAAPRAQPGHSHEVILHSASAGTAGTVAMTCWT
jgi:hypothetical protein